MNYDNQPRFLPGAVPEVEHDPDLEMALLCVATLIGLAFVLPATRATLDGLVRGLYPPWAGAFNGYLRSELKMKTHSPLKLELSLGDHRLLEAGICPLCHAFGLISGPRGGLSQNKLCPGCENEFSVGPASCEHLGRASPDRMKQAYQRQAV